VPTAVYGFISRVEREDHFQVHELDFNPPFASAGEYEAGGIAFLTATATNTIMECMRRNGDTIRYDLSTNEFAICDRDGVLRTYYKPDPSIHRQKDNIAYFKGQCLK